MDHIQFKVHRYFFERESAYFSAKLTTPVSPGTPLQGAGDGNAIVVEGVTPVEFARFLWVFYNPYVLHPYPTTHSITDSHHLPPRSRYSIYEAEIEEWETILRLAHRWEFPEVKRLAIRELEKKDILDVRRVKLYQENDVDRNFLVPRYAALCEREAPLTFREGLDLGMETALMIAHGREEVRSARTASGTRSPLTPTVHGADLDAVIRELFQIVPAEPDSDAQAAPTPGALVLRARRCTIR